MKYTKINSFIILFEIITALLSFAMLYSLTMLNNDLHTSIDNRSQMIQAADRLRQSSDELTHFARTYAITKNEKYYEQYLAVLAIRNGKIPRPYMYESVYWDLDAQTREKRHPNTKKTSLKSIINSLPFKELGASAEEIKRLVLSENNSNKLVKIELMAFEAVKNQNQKLAIKLLYSDEYYFTKNEIMNPVDKFILNANIITKDRINSINKEIDSLYIGLLFITFIFILGNYIIFRYIQKSLVKIIDEKTKDLKIINEQLEDKVSIAVEKNNKQQTLMLHQSRLAQMGEMISMIAHQWRQPLNTLAILNQGLVLKYNMEKVDDGIMQEFEKATMTQIEGMSQTIEDFRNFFKPGKEKINFCINDSIDKILDILKPVLTSNRISISFVNEKKIFINSFDKELEQALINILNNAKDALVHNEIKDRKVEIQLNQNEKNTIIKISDNAGGIDESNINNIFDSYFSTKSEKEGTGLGLYITKLIIEEQMNGMISVSNSEQGAVFEIVLLSNIANNQGDAWD